MVLLCLRDMPGRCGSDFTCHPGGIGGGVQVSSVALFHEVALEDKNLAHKRALLSCS